MFGLRFALFVSVLADYIEDTGHSDFHGLRRFFVEGFFCVAWHFAQDCVCLCLSLLAVNDIGDEGAGRLAEPLGKLTALLKLDLGGTV